MTVMHAFMTEGVWLAGCTSAALYLSARAAQSAENGGHWLRLATGILLIGMAGPWGGEPPLTLRVLTGWLMQTFTMEEGLAFAAVVMLGMGMAFGLPRTTRWMVKRHRRLSANC